MALVSIPGGIFITPFGYYPGVGLYIGSTVNAIGESASHVGEIYLTSGPGTSKTISSAGGKVWIYNSAVTWASAGSTVRVGIQDLDATGIEDGAYDVYDDLVQGVDTITLGTFKEVLMSSGTKTIAHGDKIAVVIEMTVRNGTDSITPMRSDVASGMPYFLTDIGSGPGRLSTSGGPVCVIQFDDGTIGHFGNWTLPTIRTMTAVNSGGTPDEYALIFQVPFKCAVDALGVRLNSVIAGDDAVIALVSNPLVTPVDTVTATLLGALQGVTGASEGWSVFRITETTLNANTTYAVSYRPTTTGARSIEMMTIPHADMRKAMIFGTTMQGGTRTDLGAFTPSNTVFPNIGFRVSKLDDGGVAATNEVSSIYVG